MQGIVVSELLLLIILISISAFFSASETALISLSKIRIRQMNEQKVKGINDVSKLVENPSRLLGTVLIGNTVINIGASSLATVIGIKLFGEAGVGIATGIMIFIVLVFAEIIPKSLATRHSEKISLKVARPMLFSVRILKPVVILFTYMTNGIINLFGGNVSRERPFITEDELKTMVDVGEEEGVLEFEEKEMIHNVFDFGELEVKDVMVQRMDIIAIDAAASYDKIIEILKDEQYSRMPVFRKNIDDIVGILNAKDLLIKEVNRKSFSLEDYIREAHFTYEYRKVADLLQEMKKEREHMAVVLDEYGGTAGIITVEDLVEEIVGEIEDEYDEDENQIEVIREDEYIVTGSTRLELINEMLGTNIESRQFDSIGGYIIGELERFPHLNEYIEIGSIKLIVEELDKKRIKKIRIIIE